MPGMASSRHGSSGSAPNDKRAPGRAGRPKDGSSERTHERIIAAARKLFAKHGYASTQNRAVASGAQVTASTLYHYFDSKLDIYTTVFRHAERHVAERYRAAVDGCSGDTLACIEAVVDAAERLHEEDPTIPAFLASVPTEMRHDAEIAKSISLCPITTNDILQGIFERGAERGELAPNVDLDGAVFLLYATTAGIALYADSIGHDYYPRMLLALKKMIAGQLFSRAIL
jgi:AcrR family transcriptional regulator